jgi:hypothetical protein
VDVNADGRHDVVNQGLASLAEASGRLGPAEQVTANITGTARWGNLNADAFPDLLIGTLSQFSVRLGTASGVLAAPVPRPHDIARFWNLFYVGLHDVDGDGFDDLVTLDQVLSNMDSYPPATLRLYLNDRGGGFAAPSPLDLPGGVSAQDLAFGDFNCDGRLDLVTTNPDRLRVEVRLRGPDSWQPPQALSAGRPDPLAGGVHAVAVGDVNGDGAHDLVVASTVFVQPSAIPAGDVEIFLGNGSGTLPRDPIVLVSKTEGFAPQVVTVGDLDNNGLDDIIVLLVEREDVAVVWRSDTP